MDVSSHSTDIVMITRASSRFIAAIRTLCNADFIDRGIFSKTLDRNPAGRPELPEELANDILFLLSPAASYVNQPYVGYRRGP